MRAKELRDDYEALKPKTINAVGKLLGSTGEPFDRELNEMLARTRHRLPTLPEFAVWMAEALSWARYAVRHDDFFAGAASFIDGGDPQSLDEASHFSDRFGVERLRDALAAFARWFDEMRVPLTAIEPEPLQWKAIQERSLRVAEGLKKSGELRGVGLWLFPAPPLCQRA